MKITTVSEMQAMDRKAIEAYGIPEIVLMENAGNAAFSVLQDRIDIRGKKIPVFCGSGNNGGDGFVVARKIHSNGGTAIVFLLSDRKKIKGVSKTNFDMLEAAGISVRDIGDADDILPELAAADAIVDAILGTGLSKEVRGKYREVIEAVNAAGCPVMSVDIPSGVSGDTGQIMGTAVQADWTVTFGLPKIGHYLYPGHSRCGRIYLTHISFPPQMTTDPNLKLSLNSSIGLPARNPDGHKGNFGDTLFIAGASGYYGAPGLAAMAFLKAGGGYSRLAAPESMIPHIAAGARELVFAPQKQTASGSIAMENVSSLSDLSAAVDMVVCGPGLSLDEETGRLVRKLAAAVEKPLVLDGDGITHVAEDPECLRYRKAATVLTPHMGEMARLAGLTVSAIAADRISVLRQTASDLDAIIVLKGAHSLIGMPDGRVFVNLSGNSGMATAGSGDVLTGTIAAMHGLGLQLEDAVRKGVFIHGVAGDLAAARIGEDGLTAGDILSFLPDAMRRERDGVQDELSDRYAGAVLL